MSDFPSDPRMNRTIRALPFASGKFGKSLSEFRHLQERLFTCKDEVFLIEQNLPIFSRHLSSSTQSGWGRMLSRKDFVVTTNFPKDESFAD
ncbi:hypothetical protein CH380_13265 [Leptospira adleri]|uniref:Uncharacterized protein n=1 Tax=Leptospira adleri TaxID=2023186 RepID=A0A2M9YMN1_9LEPT|nr:hypothetical protein CH380_13265 [Leptospira adleri]PJZ61740.1 hypothetical protein CH376_11545 [Leptospira adleri]